jgi:2-oxo-3-hexenedioate decarboxylase
MTNDDSKPLNRVEAIAAEACTVLGTGRQIPPFSAGLSAFSLGEAYQVAAAIKHLREVRGETPMGRKIGFTNRTIWPEYGVNRPMWGYMYQQTVHDLAEIRNIFSLEGLAEPRIEPEIVFGLAAAPTQDMNEGALLECIGWVAHGFEIVQSIFPGWKFSIPDTVVAFGLHGALLVGPHHPVAANIDDWCQKLSTFEIDLKRGGAVVDHGRAANVLDGPLLALRHLIDVLADDRFNPPLAAGEIVTTGTLTRAFPVSSGEQWATEPSGIALDGISVQFS